MALLCRGIRGVDNGNPLNIKQGRTATAQDPWAGSIGTDEIGHAQFPDPAYAVRAMLRLAWVYSRRYKLRSLNELLGRWAPADDTQGSQPGRPMNEPNKQAAFVARACGINADQPIDLFDDDGHVQPKMLAGRLLDGMAAMIEYECGSGIVYERALYQRGIAIYHLLLKP